MFYSLNETLIRSLISSAVTRLTLKPSRLRALSSNTAHCARQPAAYGRAGGGRRCWGGCVCECLWKCVAERAVVRYLYRRACFCVFACVGVRDRCRLLCQGWGRTLPPQPRCLQRLVSTQRAMGWTPFTPPHTHPRKQAHTHPAPWMSLAFTLTAGPKTTWENGEGHGRILERMFLAMHTDGGVVHLLLGYQGCQMPTEVTPIDRDAYAVIYFGVVYQLLESVRVATLINQHSERLMVQSHLLVSFSGSELLCHGKSLISLRSVSSRRTNRKDLSSRLYKDLILCVSLLNRQSVKSHFKFTLLPL